jgi:tetratricopeptide (TPR) repeat protein
MDRMRRLTFIFALLPIVALMSGCAAGEEGGEGISAAAVAEIPVTTASDEALTDYMEGQHALDVGRAQDARDLFRQAAEKDPLFTMAHLNVSNTTNSAEEFNAALDLAAANMSAATEGERLLVQINQTFLDNDVDRRLQLAGQLVDLYPASPRAWVTLAGIQTGLNRHAEARTSLTKALDLDPNHVLAHTNLGFSYLFNDPRDLTEAEVYMGRVVELEPDEPQPQINLGDVYRASQNLDDSRAAYSRALELDPTNGIALVKRGHVNSFLGYYDEARQDYDQSMAVAREQNKANFANYRAFTHVHEGNPQAAVDELERLLASVEGLGIPEDQHDGVKIFILSNQATIAMHHRMLDVAERAIERRSIHVRNISEMFGREDVSRQNEGGIAFWEGMLAARAGDYETARSKAEENANLVEPDNNPRKMEPYHNLMGTVSLLQSDYQEAVGHYRQANLNNIYVKYHLALALEGAGNEDEARALFKEVAEWNFNSVGYALVREDATQRSERARV